LSDEYRHKNDVAFGARQLVIDSALKVLIRQASMNSSETNREIADLVISYCSALDPHSEVEVEFVSTAKAYLASLLQTAPNQTFARPANTTPQ
jgi:hypothetical protein